MPVVSFLNVKGGVGKTTTAVTTAEMISARLIEAGADPAILIDLDRQRGSLIWAEGAEEAGTPLRSSVQGLEIDTQAKTARRLTKVIKDNDWVILDLPPGDDETFDTAVSLSDVAIIPAAPKKADMAQAIRAVTGVREFEIEPIVLFTMTRYAKRATLAEKEARAVLDQIGVAHFDAKVPLLEEISWNYLEPIIEDGKLWKAYSAAIHEILSALDSKQKRS